MAAGHGYDLDDVAAKFAGKLLQFFKGETADVGRIVDAVEQGYAVRHIHQSAPAVLLRCCGPRNPRTAGIPWSQNPSRRRQNSPWISGL
jgi:hypothetical protein